MLLPLFTLFVVKRVEYKLHLGMLRNYLFINCMEVKISLLEGGKLEPPLFSVSVENKHLTLRGKLKCKRIFPLSQYKGGKCRSWVENSNFFYYFFQCRHKHHIDKN